MIEKTQTILVVDDTEANIDILLELLGDEYNVVVAMDGPRAIKIVNKRDIDLILLDIMMPGMDGYETCQLLKENNKTNHIPIIFITAKSDEDSIEKGYDVGGIDYVTKPFKLKELQAKVKIQLQLKCMIEHLEYISSHDQMTGIYNRRKFFELSEELFEKSEDNLYAVMIDIDKFKAINDSYGHPFGDKVIKETTKTISSLICEGSIFGRLGGEEFAIVCVKSIEKVKETIDTIRLEIENLEIYTDNDICVKYTISSGIAQKSSHTKDLDQLLKEADDALYDAKGSGRNKTVFRSS